ncbi:hypothetical protein FJTKL_03714 [Diaporthe vaccinii]|uniref:Xaa-Pro dipeptidyl-peptidase C-terminal domain-containing protein n=1 Tax=Diaporthe vaccinii TaxID=105482 RepID=A0ABR4DUE7_9PEZI
MTPWNLGIPPGTLSGLEKFEAPDPADWVPRGCAIVNVDTRGAFDSEGTMVIMGTQEAEDGYDTIEAVAGMEWCNGKVGLAGNSHVAIAQWFIAALRPPSLAAIAPWEGCGDLYREQFARGGIYAGDLFDKLIVKYMLKGRNGIESFREMYEEHPLANQWWNDKRPDMKKITVPTYIPGPGQIQCTEWYDLWGNAEAKNELLAFFDHFLKGADNGWEKTPKVRMSILRFRNKVPQAIENIIKEDFPPPRTEYKKFYLGSEERLFLNEQQTESSSVSYLSTAGESVAFTYTFSETTRIMGMPKAVLYMSCPDHDDMDVYVMIQKLDKQGNQMNNLNIPWKGLPIKSFDEFKPEQETEVVLYKGPVGILRASHRAIDEEKSMHPHWPYHPHEVEEKVEPGKVVRLDIGIWATGIEFEQGEGVKIVISGQNFGVSNFGVDRTLNKGRHYVLCFRLFDDLAEEALSCHPLLSVSSHLGYNIFPPHHTRAAFLYITVRTPTNASRTLISLALHLYI